MQHLPYFRKAIFVCLQTVHVNMKRSDINSIQKDELLGRGANVLLEQGEAAWQREAPPKSVSLFASQESDQPPNFPQVSQFFGRTWFSPSD
jgi:hypothetical protein